MTGTVPPSSTATPLRLVSWRAQRSTNGKLRGFATVSFFGLEIIDCGVFRDGPRCWASLPGKLVLDPDGRLARKQNGKPEYTAIARWRHRKLSDRFSEVVVELVRTQHPEALAEDQT